MTQTIVNASGVDSDSLNWLKKADGHYFIEQQRNRLGSYPHAHQVTAKTAQRIIDASKMDIRKAWQLMEEYVANDI